ncbi:hypothetical protein TRVA0_015S00914 [Trichomonascus vanleenenianus]|uniref:uncharacterized protein n=1 Tax=Trichomonascus vanleenenianus TaxID=2268995 RepID=UPI003ECA34FA
MSASPVVVSADALLGEVFEAPRPKKKINKALRTFNKRVSTFGGKIGRTTGIADERVHSDSGSDNEDNLSRHFYGDDGELKDDSEFRIIHDTLIPASEVDVEPEKEEFRQKHNFIKAADVYGPGFNEHQQEKIENEQIRKAHRHELQMREHIDAASMPVPQAPREMRQKKKASFGEGDEFAGHEFNAIPQKYHHQYRNYLKRNAAAEKRAVYEARVAQEQQKLHSDRYFSYMDDINRQKQREREAEEEERRKRGVWQQFINTEDDQVNDEIENAKRKRRAKRKQNSSDSRSTKTDDSPVRSSSSDGHSDYKTVAAPPSVYNPPPQSRETVAERHSPVMVESVPVIHAPSIHSLPPPPSPAISESHHSIHHPHRPSHSRPPSLVHPSSIGSPEFDDDDEPLLPPPPNPIILDPTQPQPTGPYRPKVSMGGAASKAGNMLFEADPNPSKYSAKALITKLRSKKSQPQEIDQSNQAMTTPTMPGGFDHLPQSQPATPMMLHPEVVPHPSRRRVSGGETSFVSHTTLKPTTPHHPPQEEEKNEPDHGEELYGYWLSTKKYLSDTAGAYLWGNSQDPQGTKPEEPHEAPPVEDESGHHYDDDERFAAFPAAHASASMRRRRRSRSTARSRAMRSADLKHTPSTPPPPAGALLLKTPTITSAALIDSKPNLHYYNSDMRAEEEEGFYNSDDDYEAKERRRRKFKKAMNFVFQRKVSTPSHPLNDDPLHTPTAPPASAIYDAPSMRSGAPSIRSTYSRQTIAPTIPDGASMMSYRTLKSRSRSFAPSLRSKHSSRSIHAPQSVSPSGSLTPDHFSEHESAAEDSGKEKTGLVATWNSMTAGVQPVFSNFVQAFRSYAKLSIVLKPVDAVADIAPSMQSVVVLVELLLLMWILYQVSIVIETMATFVKTLCMPVIIVSRMIGMKM